MRIGRAGVAQGGVVLAVATGVLLGSTTLAGAHGDSQADDIHACVAQGSGLLRVVEGGGDCRSNESPLHWSPDGGSGDGGAAEALRSALATSSGTVSDADGLVHWTNLLAVPSDVITAGSELDAFISDLSTAGDAPAVAWGEVDVPLVLADGVIDAGELLGTLTGSQIARDAITSWHVDDGSLVAEDLSGTYTDGVQTTIGAVTGEKIADGSVEPRDLRANAAAGAGQAVLLAGSTSPMHQPVAATLALATDQAHRVLLTGQSSLSCQECTAAQPQSVQWQLLDGTTAASPVYSLSLTSAEPVAISYSALASGVGHRTYTLAVSTSAPALRDITISNAVLNAVDLGLA